MRTRTTRRCSWRGIKATKTRLRIKHSVRCNLVEDRGRDLILLWTKINRGRIRKNLQLVQLLSAPNPLSTWKKKSWQPITSSLKTQSIDSIQGWSQTEIIRVRFSSWSERMSNWELCCGTTSWRASHGSDGDIVDTATGTLMRIRGWSLRTRRWSTLTLWWKVK